MGRRVGLGEARGPLVLEDNGLSTRERAPALADKDKPATEHGRDTLATRAGTAHLPDIPCFRGGGGEDARWAARNRR
jgi:hypothetical protein